MTSVPGSDAPLLVASNRGPVSYARGEAGGLVQRRGAGGLVTALRSLAHSHAVTWVSHAMGEEDVEAAADPAAYPARLDDGSGPGIDLRIIGRPDTAYELSYGTIANPLLWFVQHRLYGFGSAPVIDRHTHTAWRGYATVNERIAAAVVEEERRITTATGRRPVVLVQDYHLFLTPGLVRAATSACVLQFFLHIPWPDPGAWRVLPRAWTRGICESLLACDVVGVQTHRDAENLLRTAHHYLGAHVSFRSGEVRYMGRTTYVRPYPISVSPSDFGAFAASVRVEELRGRIAAMRPAGDDGRLIVRVDRTEPTKNIVRGLAAFRLLLSERPEHRGRVTMFCQLDPSRQDVAEYVDYLARVKRAANDVNARFGTDAWTPVRVNLDSNFAAAVGAYLEYDVLFVNPVADGMNLVSKEGPLVNRRDGVVVLSDQAGSFNELGPHVVGINPFDVAEQADALHGALVMPHAERAARAAALEQHVRAHDVAEWMRSQLADLDQYAAQGSVAVR